MNNEIFNQKSRKESRKQLRGRATKAETIFWLKIKNKQMGYKFRRQHGIGKYIVDFYCPEKKLIVEIDGDVHFYDSHIEADRIRENYFKKLGLTVKRYTNLDVIKNLNNVLEDLRQVLIEL